MSLEVRATVPERDVDVELVVGSGETVALLGPNGAGKSSVLAVVAGLLRPGSGRVALDGRVLTGPSTWVPPHDRRVALLAQEPLLFPHLDARDNVAFGPRSRGLSRPESRRLATTWLTDLGVGELAARRPAQLSGGQAQRVAVARALAAEPHLLLLDEPMAALDVAVRPALRQTLRRVLADRSAVVVTHDVLDALLLADRVVVVEAGRVVEEGPTGDVLARPRSAWAARLAGLNLVRGVWDGSAVTTGDGLRVTGEALRPVPVAGDDAVAMFRPSAVSVFSSPPAGSPRNVWTVTVRAIEPRDDRIRVTAGALSADITAQAAAELDLSPGQQVVFVVKAVEVSIYPTGSGR